MEVLMDPGVQVSDPEARKIFKENGCEVNEKTQIVKIPEYLVRKALQLAPSRFILWGRDKRTIPSRNAVAKYTGPVSVPV